MVNFEPQPIGGLHFERVIFKDDFVSLTNTANLDQLLTSFSQMNGFDAKKIAAYRTVMRAFFSGIQFTVDTVPHGKEPMIHCLFADTFTYRNKYQLVFPAYSADHKKIVVPKAFIIFHGNIPTESLVGMNSKENIFRGHLPNLAYIGDCGVEEAVHAIQHFHGRLPVEKLNWQPDLVPEYSSQPHEVEARYYQNLFLSQICNIRGFYK